MTELFSRERVKTQKIEMICSRVGLLLTGSTLGKVWVQSRLIVCRLGLRYGLLPLEKVSTPIGCTAEKCRGFVNIASLPGSKELACGSQAFIATLLFDPSMSALPIIPKQNSVSVGLFTH